MLLKYYERYQNLTISSWLRVDNFVCPDVKHQDIGGKKKKILIQLSLFYIGVAQNKTKQN